MNVPSRLTTIALISTLFFSGCAAQPQPTLPPQATLAITDVQARHIDQSVTSKSAAAGKGVVLGTLGMVGGGAVGGVVGGIFGMACGPLAIVCVPMAMAAGAGVGGVAGGAAGAEYGGRGGISGPKAKRFNAVATANMAPERVQRELLAHFSHQAGQRWRIAESAANQVSVELRSIDFVQPGKERVQLSVNARMHLDVAGKKHTRQFQHVTPPIHIDRWLMDDGALLNHQLEAGLSDITQQMVASIAP